MMTPRDQMIAEISRAQGVIMTMYGIIRGLEIASLVPSDANGKLGDVVGDTMNGLNSIVELWDGSSANEKDEDTDNE